MLRTPDQPELFDPFAATQRLNSSKWFWAMTLQAGITSILLACFWMIKGYPQERSVRFILLIGIIATWSLALRTIRERLVELTRYWHNASRGLLRRCSESGRHLIAVPFSAQKELYIKKSIWRLRIIAAGLTIPFFVMPFVFSIVSVALSLTVGPVGKEFWAGIALTMMFSALVVAGYLHWAILVVPAPVRVTGRTQKAVGRRQ